jgi:cobalt-zinc-cadmium efflux system protein
MALALIVGFMAVEVAVGVLPSSMAPPSDAAHMLTDAAPDRARGRGRSHRTAAGEGVITHGLGRAEILCARLTGATLLDARMLIV